MGRIVLGGNRGTVAPTSLGLDIVGNLLKGCREREVEFTIRPEVIGEVVEVLEYLLEMTGEV